MPFSALPSTNQSVGRARPHRAGVVTGDPFYISRKMGGGEGNLACHLEEEPGPTRSIGGDNGDFFCLILSDPFQKLL